MPKSRNVLEEVIARLKAVYGRPAPPAVVDPLELILLENVAYLVGDEQREKAFEALRERIGTTPESILSAPDAALLEVARLGGINARQRAQRLQLIARIALEEFEGDLRWALKQPLAQARKSLKLFPAIGDPGAEKILLFSRSHRVLALDSNGLRVLVRLGFGEERKNYAATYRSAQDAIRDYLRDDYGWLIRRQRLRNDHPNAACSLTDFCRFYQVGRVSHRPGTGGRARQPRA